MIGRYAQMRRDGWTGRATPGILRCVKLSAFFSGWVAVGLVGTLGACTSSESPSPPSDRATATTIGLVEHSAGANDVVLQVGDYHLGEHPDWLVTGPEIVVYGDGRLYAELFDGFRLGTATWSRVQAKLSPSQMQALLLPGEDLPVDPPMDPLAVDLFPILIVSASHRWEVNDPEAEPFVTYLTSIRSIVRSFATEAWVPERWVVRVFPSPTCTVTNAPSTDSLYDAPVYPGMLDRFPLGTVECYPAPQL